MNAGARMPSVPSQVTVGSPPALFQSRRIAPPERGNATSAMQSGIAAATMAISLWPIWAWLVAFSDRWPASRPGKRVENRTWPTKHRGGLLIQAGLKWDRGYVERTIAELEDLKG